jgi:hypothetical protein
VNYSKGITWFNDCRIPFVDDGDMNNTLEAKYTIGKGKQSDMGFGTKKIGNVSKPEGRYPANLLCSDDMLNDGLKTNKGHHPKSKVTGYGEFGNGKSEYFGKGEYSSVDSKSRYYDIDKWFNKLLDEL